MHSCGPALLGDGQRLGDLVDVLVLGAALGREREHGHARRLAHQAGVAVGGGDGDVGELLGFGIDDHRAVGEEEDAVLAEGLVRRNHGEEAGQRLEPRLHADDLDAGAADVGGGVGRAAHEALAQALAHHHGAVEQRDPS